MPRVTNNLRDARILADFSNLKPEGAEYFRNNFPDFATPEWWDYKHYKRWPQWQLAQNLVRRVWEERFDVEFFTLAQLMFSIYSPDTEDSFDELLFDYPELRIKLSQSSGEEPSFPAGPKPNLFQRAVLYLVGEPWRVRFCAECNKRFVAAEPKNKFCSDFCSNENRLRQKREAWHAHKKEWRPKARR
jgi:hypothetical protein